MKKKYRRKEREQLIREKERLQRTIDSQTKAFQEREKALLERIEMAGSEIETIDEGCGPMQVIRAKVGIFGTYARMIEVSEREMEYYKQNLAEQIAKKLIDEGIAQVIVHERGEDVPPGYSPYDNSTIGVKLFVIPWEQMRTVGSRFEMRRMLWP
jgi:hypothetical protein